MTFAAAKANIASELIGRLDAVADGKAPLSELAQIKFSAQRLRNVSRADFLMVLGIAAAIEGNKAEFDAHFNEAFEEFGFEPQLTLNAYMALSDMGMLREGLEILRRGALNFRDVEALGVSFSVFAGLGLYSDALKVAGIFDRMTGENYQAIVSAANERFPEIEISEDSLLEANERLREFFRSKGFPRTLTNYNYDMSDDVGPALVLRVNVPDTPEAVFQMEREANEYMLAAGLPAVERGGFSWYFVPSSEAPRARNLG